MRAIAILSKMFRVRKASRMVSKGGTMLYHGAAGASAVGCDSDRAASAQMAAKMTAAAAVLVRVFMFTSSVQPGVFGISSVYLEKAK